METYTELEYQRRHLVEQTTPEGRAMVLCAIDRLLDSMLVPIVESQLPNSPEGQAHIERGNE